MFFTFFTESGLLEVKQAIEGVDVIIDLTYAYDPPSYDYDAFLENFDLSGETDIAKFPFLENKLVFRTDKVRIKLGIALDDEEHCLSFARVCAPSVYAPIRI